MATVLGSEIRTRGWWLIGPMVPVCSDCAPTEDEARASHEESLHAWPLTDKMISRMVDPTCFRCGRLIEIMP